MSGGHRLTPAGLADLDQAHMALAADLDTILAQGHIRQSLTDDGIALACAKLTLGLDEEIRSRLGLAGVAALAVLRLIDRDTPTVSPAAATDRQLLVDVHRWARTNGWNTVGTGWANARFERDATIIVDWDHDELSVRRRPVEQAGTYWPWGVALPRQQRYPVTSVRQAVDFLVALDVLPPRFSSAHRAAVAR